MKGKTFFSIISAFLISISSVSGVYAERIIASDINGDELTDVFDLVMLRGNLENIKCDLNNDSQTDAKDLIFLNDYIVKGKMNTQYTIDESAILEPKGTIHYGEGTFYGGGYEGGCAMLDPISKDDYWIVAMNLEDYNDAQLAGAYIQVTGELGTINMFVSDLLPEGKKGDLDLYTDAFPLIAPVEKGRVPVSWKIIPLDSAENASVSFKFKEGSTAYWCGVQVRNHRYPITKLEYLNAEGEFIEINRRPYNYFESMEMGAGPFTFRITDIYGQVIVEKDIPLVLDEIIGGENQFPL